MKLLRYEDPKTCIHTYGMSDNPFFKDKNLRYVFTVKENGDCKIVCVRMNDSLNLFL